MRRIAAILMAALPAQAIAAPPTDLTYECTFTSKVQCGISGECERLLPTTVHIVLAPRDGTYQRCDSRGCDTYRAAFTPSGDYLNATVPQRAMFAKVSNDFQVTEVVSLGHVVIVAHGQCVPIVRTTVSPPPR